MNSEVLNTDIEGRIRKELLDRIQGQDFFRFPVPDRRKIIDKITRDISDSMNLVLPEDELTAIALRLDEDSFDMGPISLLLKDPSITEIMINGFDRVYIEREGRIFRESVVFKDSRHIKNIVEKILGPLGLRVDESNPMVDARLGDGSRINVVISPISSDDIVVTIRKFKNDMKSMSQLVKAGSLNSRMAEFLSGCVRNRINILISGGTGTGKTTLLNLLSQSITESERIITIEETLELRFIHENLVRLEARSPNIEGRGQITIRDLVRNALRMRPDRLIVGEIRGPEAVDVLQAMNTGHSGSMTTIHANTPGDAVTRLETMLLISGSNMDPFTAERVMGTSLEMIIQLGKLEDGRRMIQKVSEVIYGNNNGNNKAVLRLEDIAVSENSGSSGRAAEFTGYNPSFLKV